MDELIGFVSGNPKREKILSLFASRGALNAGRVAKTTHIIESSAKRLLEEMVEKGLLAREDEEYTLTDTGREVEGRIRGMR